MIVQSVKKNYEDIINLPHPVSEKHMPMARKNRAAQFAPFAALSGLAEKMGETAVETEEQYKESISPFIDDWGIYD